LNLLASYSSSSCVLRRVPGTKAISQLANAFQAGLNPCKEWCNKETSKMYIAHACVLETTIKVANDLSNMM